MARSKSTRDGASRGTFGTYATGDVFRVALVNGVVQYSKNGTLLYTSAVTPILPLFADTSFYSPGATLGNVVISGTSQPTVTAPVISSATTATATVVPIVQLPNQRQ